MEFTTNTLKEALSLTRHSAASKPTLRILSHVLIQPGADRTQVTLSTTDLSTFTTVFVQAADVPLQSIAVPHRVLDEYVKVVVDDKVALTIDSDAYALELDAGVAHARFDAMDAEEFPALASVEGIEFTLSGNELALAIDRVAYAASTDETRPILQCVHFEVLPAKEDALPALRAVAVDGFRMAYHEQTLSDLKMGSAEPVIANIDAVALLMMRKALADHAPEQVRVAISKGYAQFEFNGVGEICKIQFTCDLQQGQFVQYNTIIPPAFDTRARIDRNTLLNTLRMIDVVSARSTGFVYIDLYRDEEGRGMMRLIGRSSDIGETVAEFPCELEGPELELAYQSAFIKHAVHAMEAKDVVLEMVNSIRPMRMRRILDGKVDESTFALIMPCHRIKPSKSDEPETATEGPRSATEGPRSAEETEADAVAAPG